MDLVVIGGGEEVLVELAKFIVAPLEKFRPVELLWVGVYHAKAILVNMGDPRIRLLVDDHEEVVRTGYVPG